MQQPLCNPADVVVMCVYLCRSCTVDEDCLRHRFAISKAAQKQNLRQRFALQVPRLLPHCCRCQSQIRTANARFQLQNPGGRNLIHQLKHLQLAQVPHLQLVFRICRCLGETERKPSVAAGFCDPFCQRERDGKGCQCSRGCSSHVHP